MWTDRPFSKYIWELSLKVIGSCSRARKSLALKIRLTCLNPKWNGDHNKIAITFSFEESKLRSIHWF